MATIQIEVSAELAERLQRYQDDLPRILEQGLREVEREPETQQSAPSTRQEILDALRSAGLVVESDPAVVARYLAERRQRDSEPITVGGKPISELIVEERKQRWGEKA